MSNHHLLHPHHPLPIPLGRKRSSEAISSHDETSRPPSRAHAHIKKRPRFKNHLERPRYVTEKASSIPLLGEASGRVEVDVLWPAKEEMERQLFGEFLSGKRAGKGAGGGNWSGGFSVLCFLGYTIEHLKSLSQVASLLGNFDAHIFGVSLFPPPPNSSSLPIIHDYTRSLTLQLGLMHPLGGGRQSLDAIVVLDRENRRRMLLPVGWGVPTAAVPGQGGGRPVVGCTAPPEDNSVQSAVGNCVKGVEWLVGEREEEGEVNEMADVEMEMDEEGGV
ncbi:hypothetical protein L211DRAFT_242031 [Terfezia boudieri ATCC MYA-4762]|uniref:Uncharacterized protein n=1 Tax=Terfezia boudieri ATCC MYA-4762 TaxID=1051890 RepID=A0A3N4M1D7_9PEZI|nr:hypothetical protein L211DRAFT_242031 [Terfezia boudieri ATCC MYA-4762]